ncbi:MULTISPECIES: PucR family transcriptional regulator [unclassified Enterococcus]|uniref:PucR family transcriptional regulator n=1 Tax=unclassified Enterococcus TaxID=2608891 RepID=UPI0015581931|nr:MULTISPECIES: PucR family transcriptional regulator [unclassified Enterococcus]MBS7577021.1 PucR family transcriptional regulator ligand-binding domain-containing protein [Enterococcus sp. MMGLQ5-2]MBS7584532.1 PucR family transcriptional regulator ligand-binding domain-containing protein [Enterococcus sp. MMGLQ5-1]NPD12387.1 PucR family transcriptional regulator [Enterococcus sp. MMGLQ5-1]NPD36855.1 PucR family transcriptional regulator [Enterococcus sp. MMGLQ5-2]
MELYELLDSEEASGIKVVNERADLSIEVSTIGMMEAPDISDFLVDGQLLVTTGYHFQNDVPALLALLEMMKERGCAAIGIKEQRYFDEIPPEVVELANELRFPILLLPKTIGLSVIVRNLLHRLLKSQSDLLRRIIEYNNELSHLILQEERTNLFLEKIASIIGKDVFLINSHYQITHSNQNIYYQHQEIGDLIKASIDEELLEVSEILATDFKNQPLVLHPIQNNFKSNVLFLGILNFEQNDPFIMLLIQQIINLLSFATLRTSMNQETKRQIKNEFLASILVETPDSKAVEEQLKFQGIDSVKPQKCAIIKLRKHHLGSLINFRVIRRVHDYVEWFIEEEKVESQIFIYRDDVIIFTSDSFINRSSLPKLQEYLYQHFSANFYFDIGYAHSNLPLTELTTLYQEARQALTLRRDDKVSTLNEYRPKAITELLHLIPDNEVESFIDNHLFELINLPQKLESEELMETLYQYLLNGCSVSKVAAVQYIHRNTVIYRLKKIQQYLNVNLEDSEVRMQLMIALLLLRKDRG